MISGNATQDATGFTSGSGGVQVFEAAVAPLQGALVLMLSGIAGLGLVARRLAA